MSVEQFEMVCLKISFTIYIQRKRFKNIKIG